MSDFVVSKVENPLSLLQSVGVDPASIPIFQRKGTFVSLMIYDVPVIAANVIKQEMLAAGGDAAVHKHAITHKVEKTNVLTMGTIAQHQRVVEKLSMMHYWQLDEIAKQIERCLFQQRIKQIELPSGKKLVFDRTLIMGIVNLTPDSFYKGSRVDGERVVDFVAKMIKEGVDIVDLGGESTRPGSERITEEEELNRVIPAVELIKKNFDVIISVDTYRAPVAQEALKIGADIINDISALRFDERMAQVLLEYKPAIVLMHMKGEPKTMQENPHYDDVIKELLFFFKERLELMKKLNLADRVIIDPGIGFGKRLEDNLEILRRIDEFKSFKVPVLVGASRKSFIGAILNNIPPEERLYGTLAVTAYCVSRKVDIVRVHDVLANSHVAKLISALINR
ncbi:dihydropteroate synthase [Pseudothermotoga sp. U03pept]|uniref:dihydropteroate synthase n=1 Tax=Pseudothermotoga sp. U03pept TaxID=3447012 RepID=UPI003EFFD5C1